MVSGSADNERFEMRGELGTGSSGAVYRVLDRERGHEVALKTLRQIGGPDLFRFKREFRALAGLSHPHLATLYELYAVGAEWMYTMELIEGVPFDQWVRGAPPTDRDGARLRDALGQLADGLLALHALGKIHRDLKPTNVLCEPGGRLVLLDFGLVADPDSTEHTHEHSAVGTLAYMSPEQAADVPLTPASDWYGIGVMLYEALTGLRPFRGATHDVLLRKQREDPPAPSTLADVPADLDALCMRLLDRDPERRPDGRQILAALGREPSAATQELLHRPPRPNPAVRPDSLDALRAALTASRDHFTIVVVHGAAGSGKTALVEALLDEARRDHGALTLTASENPREQVPYVAIDQMLDQLSSHVLGLPPEEASALVADAAPLARLFPALRRVPALQVPVLPQSTPLGPTELLHRGMAALRRVFGRLGASRPLVIVVDEIGDASASASSLLTDHFAGPDMPRAMIVIVGSPELIARHPTIANFRRWRDEMGGDLRFVQP